MVDTINRHTLPSFFDHGLAGPIACYFLTAKTGLGLNALNRRPLQVRELHISWPIRGT
jgi:hypothetical protein